MIKMRENLIQLTLTGSAKARYNPQVRQRKVAADGERTCAAGHGTAAALTEIACSAETAADLGTNPGHPGCLRDPAPDPESVITSRRQGLQLVR